MANHFHDLSTDSAGEKRDGRYWQSARSKDVNQDYQPKGNAGPDEPRVDLAKPNTPLKGVTTPSPQLRPSL